VLQQGKLIEQGNIREIFQNPREAYTRHLLSCRLSPVAKNNIQPANALQPDYSKPPLLEMKNIEVSFTTSRFNIGKSAEKKILQHINLQLWEGETLGIVGESGSGKTTLGRSLMQLIRYRGDISLNGQPVDHLMTSDRKKFYRQVQLIFQDPYSSLNPRMRISKLSVFGSCSSRFVSTPNGTTVIPTSFRADSVNALQ
jgi:peptide/nickel transport system ATP-binding protein